MRLILVNPHIFSYGKAVLHTLTGQKNYQKYSYFIKFYVKNKDRQTAFFIDGKRSSFRKINTHFEFLGKLFCYLELLVWMLINKINPLKQKVYFNLDKLNPQNDIIFSFSRSNDNPLFYRYEGVCVHHLTHYHKNTKATAEYLSKLKNNFLVAEGALVNNDYFRNFFPNIKEVYQLPFVYAERFAKTKDFNQRLNKCFAIGSLLVPPPDLFKDYTDYFGEGVSVHPMRKIIFEKQVTLKDCIDSYIHDYGNSKDLKKFNQADSLGVKLAKKYLPYFILTKLFSNYQQSYFKFNIVEKYNEYKMFISPEERTGLPSVNVFEGMACGTAFVGIDDPMYTNLGMINGENYIAYKERDLNDLVQKIKYYQTPENQEKLAKIANKGYEFVKAKLAPQTVADTFWKDLEYLLKTFNEGKTEFRCSFKEV